MMLSSPHHLGLLALPGAFMVSTGAALLAGSGCASDVSDALADDAGAFEGSDAGVASCAPCVASQCTAAWALCLTDESCLAVRRCGAATGCDEACATSCVCAADADGGSGGALYRAFAACTDARRCAEGCATDCASSCAAAAPTTTPAACHAADASTTADAGNDSGSAPDAGDFTAPGPATADSCASCAEDKCGDAKKACAVGSECASFLACTFGCTDSGCTDDCGRLHATGKVAAVELATCTQTGCKLDCGLGTLE